MNPTLWFRERCAKNGLQVSDEQLRLLEQLAAGLLDWNKKINLIARTDQENIWNRHILGSISFLFSFSLPESYRMIDVGTGGGFPGLPLAILFPEARFTLVDSIQKKMMVVDDLIRQLRLANAETRCGRAEDLSSGTELHKAFDFVVARAVAPTKDLIKWTGPFLQASEIVPLPKEHPRTMRPLLPRGSLLLLKGGELTEEIEEATITMKPRQVRVYPLVVDGADAADPVEKKLVIIQP